MKYEIIRVNLGCQECYVVKEYWETGTIYLHKEDGPAVINKKTGKQQWYKNGMLHREDGPAAIHLNWQVEWWLKGQNMSFNTWCKRLKKTEEEIIQLKLQYGKGFEIMEISA